MVRFEKRIVFLGGPAGQRLKPVRVVARTLAERPRLHGAGHVAGDIRVQRRAVADRLKQLLVSLGRQEFLHRGEVEHIFPEKLLRAFRYDPVGDARGGRRRHVLYRLPSGLVAHTKVTPA